MSRYVGRMLALAVLVPGCASPFGFGGQDLEIDASATADAPMEGDFAEADSTCDEGTVEPALAANGGVGLVDMVHSFDGDCCAEWTTAAVISDTEDWVIDISHTNEAAECGCTCGWTLDFRLVDVPAGDWAVRADGIEVSTTVQ